MNEIEEEVKEDTNEKPSQLDRDSILNPTNAKKKNFGIFGVILMGIAAVLLMFLFNGKEKPKEGLQKDPVEFEPPPKRELVLPEAVALPETPSEKDLEREEVLKQARLKSAVVIYGGNNSSGGQPVSATSVTDSGSSENKDPNRSFQQEVGNSTTARVKASQLGSLNQMILEGKLIDAILETAVNSDLPGMVRAIISHDIYGESGENVLIPRGSRLVGQYNSQITKGQSRVFVVWTRVIRPDGIEVALNSGGTDSLGRAGISGSVNHHFWQIFGASSLMSIVGAGTANAGVNSADAYNSASAYRQQLAQGFQGSSSSLLEGYINIPPTIEIKQGTPIKVFVARDLDFSDALASLEKPLVVLP